MKRLLALAAALAIAGCGASSVRTKTVTRTSAAAPSISSTTATTATTFANVEDACSRTTSAAQSLASDTGADLKRSGSNPDPRVSADVGRLVGYLRELAAETPPPLSDHFRSDARILGADASLPLVLIAVDLGKKPVVDLGADLGQLCNP